jgi:crotonobetainyl-CoA:carnitine CoA-transferase CaiB-like acyl-CoA transferase
MPKPLDGIKVLDVTRHLPGPLCTLLLADLGAEVVKVEDPVAGDPMRLLPPSVGDFGAPFLFLNRGKKSLALDLRRAEARPILEALLGQADVLVQGFRPERMASLGLGPEEVLHANPRIVYCSITGFGLSGRPVDRPAHDLNFAALAGILAANTDAAGRPRPTGLPVTDTVAGVLAAVAILASLHRRSREGKGEVIDLSLLDSGVFANMLNLASAVGGDWIKGPTLITGAVPSYGIYRTSDGAYLSLAALEDKFWVAFCRLAGLGEEVAAEPFPRGRHRAHVRRRIAEAIGSRTMASWLEALDAADIPHAAVRSPSDVMEDRDLEERGTLGSLELPGGRGVKVVGFPARLSSVHEPAMTPAPTLGESTQAIILSLGIPPEVLEDLRGKGVIGGPKHP